MFGKFAQTNLENAGTDSALAIALDSPILRSDLQGSPLQNFSPLHNSPASSSHPPSPPNNIAPENLRFGLNRRDYSLSDTHPILSTTEIDHPAVDTPIPARCGCAFHLAGGELNYAGSASLAEMMGLS